MVVAVLAVTSGGGWAAAGEGRGRLPVVMQRQVLQSCTDSVLRRRGGASATVHRQNVSFLVVNRDRYHSCFGWSSSCVWEQYIDKVVDVPVVTRLGCCMRLVEEFHIVSTCLRCSPGSRRYFHELLVSGSHLPLCVATVHGDFWTNFFYFPRESGLRAPRALLTLDSQHYFYEQYLAVTVCVSLRSFWKNLGFFFVKVDSEGPGAGGFFFFFRRL